MPGNTFDEMSVDHVEFYVRSISAGLNWLSTGLGLEIHAQGGKDAGVASVALASDQIRLVLTQPLVADHPGSAYIERHGDGVSDIALRVPDARAAFAAAVGRGARPVASPAERDGVVTASITGFGDVLHTFVERRDGVDHRALPGLRLVASAALAGTGLRSVDHFAICVPAGELAATVEFYERVLDFELTLSERIVVGDQAIETRAVQSRSREVTFTLIEPDVSREPGQIDKFLKDHDGAGVQHIAFTTDDIVRAVDTIGRRGTEFLTTPDAYFRQLRERPEPVRHPVEELRRLGVLVDEDHAGMLFQIFTRSVHPRKTLFLEVIERFGVQTFGSGNIKALYEAVELERAGMEAGL